MREKLTLLQQHNPRKPIIQIPKINTAHTPFIIQLPINIKRIIRTNLHLPQLITRNSALSSPLIIPLIIDAPDALSAQRRFKLAGPGRPVAVAVAVVVAQQIVAAGLAAAGDCEGLVDGGEQVFGQGGDE
jgi:hypothetical protein